MKLRLVMVAGVSQLSQVGQDLSSRVLRCAGYVHHWSLVAQENWRVFIRLVVRVIPVGVLGLLIVLGQLCTIRGLGQTMRSVWSFLCWSLCWSLSSLPSLLDFVESREQREPIMRLNLSESHDCPTCMSRSSWLSSKLPESTDSSPLPSLS